WKNRSRSQRCLEDDDLKVEIQAIYDANEGRYGSPRIFKALIKQGYSVGKKRIERLMRELGLVARVIQVTRRAPGSRRFLASGENLRSNGGVPDEKNKVWVADVT
ncbi:IS3 family transposase, partial [Aestuariirhabdus sp. Z084]|uniref:IS3 family transposase n=1 Tax=Aestuariirhabdus haliotis TaxID=2918751 RepID=UPI00201B3B62